MCEFYEICPIFKKSDAGRIKGVYVFLFCKGSRRDDCERRKMKLRGEDVPLTLLPTGDYMMSLTED